MHAANEPVSSREAERKYALGDDTAEPSLDLLLERADLGEVGPERRAVLVADYFDTPELDLLHGRITLRRRTGGEDAGWHLKTPGDDPSGDGEVRAELRLPLDVGRRLPAAIRDRVADLVEERPLLPIVRMTTRRTTRELLRADGTVRAELCLDAVTAEVRRGDAVRRLAWTELELELAGDEPTGSFAAIEPGLLAAGCVRDRSPSKLSRILDGVPPAPELGADDHAAAAVAARMAKYFGRLQSLETALRANEEDAVHRARVSMRRMRSHLQAFGACFDRADAVRLRDELRWAGDRLGEARDAEVIVAALDGLLDGLEPAELVGPVRERIDADLAARHERGLDRMRHALDTERWDALQAALAEFLVEVPATARGARPVRTVLPALGARTVGLVAERTERAESRPDDLDRWHDVRKAVKRARYAYETLEALGLAGAGERRAEWEELAGVFGEIQDAAILSEQLESFAHAAAAAGEPLDTYELLQRRLDAECAATLETARAAVAEALIA